MIYTLTTWALWLLGAAAVGGVVGWLLRARRPSSPRTTARQEGQAATRFDSLELVAQERDRLRAELVELRRTAAASPGPTRPERSGLAARGAAISVDLPAELATAAAERDRLAAALSERDGAIRELRVRLWNDEVRIRELEDRLRSRSVPEG